MGALVQVLYEACGRKIDELADTIQGEMKGIVGGHHQSGLAVSAIHIESMGEFKKFVGGTDGTGTGKTGTDHLAMLNSGNGGNMIYPKNGRALRYFDGSLHGSSRPYGGIHFVEEIASRHGGY